MKTRSGQPSTTIGQDKERLAERFLQDRQLRLLERRYRCRFGEIDLIMRDGSTLAFVEVRYRRSERYGSPAETVNVHKQRRLALAAKHYLMSHPCTLACRFDVVAISGSDQVRWIKNAFVLDPA